MFAFLYNLGTKLKIELKIFNQCPIREAGM